MLNIIYTTLDVATPLLSLAFLIFMIILIKKLSHNVKIATSAFIFALAIFTLYLVQLVIAIILSELIPHILFNIVFWTILIISLNSIRKRAKKIAKFEAFMDRQLKNEDLIDVEYSEITDK